jgi:hypothetical protein
MYDQPEDTEARKRHEAEAKVQGLIKAALRVPDAGGSSAITDIRDFFGKRAGKAEMPPRDPSPRSPSRQTAPTKKVETKAVSRLDWYSGKTAA